MKDFEVSWSGNSVLDLIYENPFFAELTPEQMRIVGMYWRIMKCKKGKVLFNENDDADYLYYVLDGTLEVFKTVVDNRADKRKMIKVADLHKDSLIGELAIIDGSKRSATVVATSSVILLALQAKHFNLLVKSRPEIGIVLMRQVAKLICSKLKDTTVIYASSKGNDDK